MHELALVQGILSQCLTKAEAEKAKAIQSITLEIGDHAGVSLDALEFAFQVASRGGLAEKAKLIIQRLHPMGECPTCGGAVCGEAALGPCPSCEGPLTLVQGRELRIKSMEIEECAKTADA